MNLLPTGITGLDRLLGGGIRERSLVLLAGNPGTGKTTLAATILYAGCKRGVKGLYLSFVENEEDFLEHMDSVGLGLRECRDKGLFRFVEALQTADEEGLAELMTRVYEEVRVNGYRLVAIDSVSAMMQTVAGQAKARELVKNFMYDTLRAAGATVIAISELPIGANIVGYGVEEFIADAILILRAVERLGCVRRTMEVRKVRWAPITRMKLHFRIRPGKPIEVLAPELLHEVELHGYPGASLYGALSSLKLGGRNVVDVLDSSGRKLDGELARRLEPLSALPRGSQIVVTRRDIPSVHTLILALAVVRALGDRAAVVSTRTPSRFIEAVARECMSIEKDKGSLRVYSLNPMAYTPEEYAGLIRDVVESHKVDALVLEGVEMLQEMGSRDEVIDNMINLMIWLKHRGVTTFHIILGEADRALTAFSDAYIELALLDKGSVKVEGGRLWQYVAARAAMPQISTRFMLRYDLDLLWSECISKAIEVSAKDLER
ncbi:MAG: ATPase domain-containing protein [Thermoproteota archaeon]